MDSSNLILFVSGRANCQTSGSFIVEVFQCCRYRVKAICGMDDGYIKLNKDFFKWTLLKNILFDENL